ncbi:MAG: hypothetical protein HKL90_10720 [Elusimicrobia bacterium]|nr:hypothetical protein [Elusimicrobiota bacterium]
MKTVLVGILSAGIAGAFLPGCALLGGAGPRMNASPTVPAAEGRVKFGGASNGNTSIDLTVKHLADPARLTPPANNYVVWVRASKNAAAQNIGALSVDKNLTGTLNTVTALRTFDLFITAEGSGQVQLPTGQPLLWTSHSE